MEELDLIVIGASAGGLDALINIVKRLPQQAPAVVIVLHTRRDGDSFLPQILNRVSVQPVKFAEAGDTLIPGRVLVAPPDFHVLVSRGKVALNRGPRENGFRPAVDPLFRTAARAYRNRVMGVVLSGALDDGAYGMKVMKDHGAVTVVQSPDEALVPSMPLNVLKSIEVDHVLPAAAIGDLIANLPHAEHGERTMTRPKDPEPQNVNEEMEVRDMAATFGPPTGLTCPDCGGALWEIKDDKLTRYACHVGHQFSPEGLDAEQAGAVEAALWSAVRVLEEHTELRLRMAERSDDAGLTAVSAGFRTSAHESRLQAGAIRELLFGRDVPEPAPAGAENGKRLSRHRPTVNEKPQKANGRGTRKHGKRARRT